jgi:hypothetical protein
MYLRDDKRLQETADINKQKAEYDISSDYDISTDSLSKVGQSGTELNKQFGGLLSPFEEGKFYNPKQKEVKSNLEGSYENPKTKTIWKYDETNRVGVDTGIPYDTSKGKSGSGNGSGSDKSNGKLTNQYEIVAFSNLKNSGTGEEDKEYTPQMRDRDFNTVANALLPPSVMRVVTELRQGSGSYPTVNELIDGFKAAGLKGKDAQSAEDFLEYYSQIESTLAPTKVNWWQK